MILEVATAKIGVPEKKKKTPPKNPKSLKILPFDVAPHSSPPLPQHGKTNPEIFEIRNAKRITSEL